MISDVARLRQEIEQSIQSARLGLSGLREGTSRHAFIEAAMSRGTTSPMFKRFKQEVGEQEATAFFCQTYHKVMEP